MNDIPFLTPLNPEQQQQAGLPKIWPLAMADRVRFNEIDMLGHVNNAAYLTWFEKLRTIYVQECGLTTYDQKNDPRICIRSGEIHWKKEMRRNEAYIVTARATAYRTTSFTIASEIWAGDLRAIFSCVCFTLMPDGFARRPLSQTFIDHMRTIDGALPASSF